MDEVVCLCVGTYLSLYELGVKISVSVCIGML